MPTRGVPRVLDTTSGIAGAYAALVLHWAGGEVVRVGGGEVAELPASSALAHYLRQGQRVVDLGDRSPFDDADIWLGTPTGTERDALREQHSVHPRLVIVAITPYGLEGPFRDRPTSDLTLQADSGALAIRGKPGQEPFQMGARTAEWLAGSYAAAAALACWQGRLRGGPGALIDLSIAEAANVGASNFMDVFHAIGEGPDAEPSTPPRVLETPSIERTSDGWVGFNTNGPHQIRAFLEMIDRHDLAESGEFMMAGARISRMAEWQEIVSSWVSVRTTDEVIAAALARQVPVAPVCNGRTVTELDHVIARQNLTPSPDGHLVPDRPWRVDGDRHGPGPLASEHGGSEPAAIWRTSRAALPAVDPQRLPGLPLRGVRVLDLTTWWAGPSATGLLAAFGADVIHVEGPERMDGSRMVGMSFPKRGDWWELSPFFLTVNPNKRDLALDLTSARGRELALRLVQQVDVVVENFTPRVLDKLGLGWEAIHAANPRVVLVRMPAFGLDGPWRERPGFAQNIEQASGLAWLTGQADDQPRIQRGPCDPNGGLHAVIALMASLPGDDPSDVGCVIESALFDAALPLAAEAIIEWTSHGRVLHRQGNRSELAAPQGVYRCAGLDKWVAITVASDEQWAALTDLLDRPDLDVPELATMEGRRARHDELDDVLTGWMKDQESDAVVDALIAVGIPAALARDPRLTPRHPQFKARRFNQLVDHPATGPIPIPTQPFRVDGVSDWIRSPAPSFGQHTTEVLVELLDLTGGELDGLRAQRVIADGPLNT